MKKHPKEPRWRRESGDCQHGGDAAERTASNAAENPQGGDGRVGGRERRAAAEDRANRAADAGVGDAGIADTDVADADVGDARAGSVPGYAKRRGVGGGAGAAPLRQPEGRTEKRTEVTVAAFGPGYERYERLVIGEKVYINSQYVRSSCTYNVGSSYIAGEECAHNAEEE